MIYSLIHKLPLWTNIGESKRNVQTFMLSTMIYIIFASILHSGALNKTKYGRFLKQNIYSIWLIDVLYLGVSYHYDTKNEEIENIENLEDNTEIHDDTSMIHSYSNENEKNNSIESSHVNEKNPEESKIRKTIFNKDNKIYSEIKPVNTTTSNINNTNEYDYENNNEITNNNDKQMLYNQEENNNTNKIEFIEKSYEDDEDIPIYNKSDNIENESNNEDIPIYNNENMEENNQENMEDIEESNQEDVDEEQSSDESSSENIRTYKNTNNNVRYT